MIISFKTLTDYSFDRNVAYIAYLTESFAFANVAYVNFNRGNPDSLYSVGNGNARMGLCGRIEHYSVHLVKICPLNGVNKSSLMI